jgi:hypothetical protein
MDFYVVIQEQEQAYKAVFMHLAWMAVSLVWDRKKRPKYEEFVDANG